MTASVRFRIALQKLTDGKFRAAEGTVKNFSASIDVSKSS